MRIGSRIGTGAFLLVLACATLAAPRHDLRPQLGMAVVRVAPSPLEASGGRLRHANGCAFGLGLMTGGIVGMGLNPMGGATAFAVGACIALVTCI